MDLHFEKFLGKGAFGSVSLYKGRRDDGTTINVAVKTSNYKHAKSLFKEIQILSEFERCSRIVQCYGNRVLARLNEQGCVEYKIPMEYAHGGSLLSFMDNFKERKVPDPLIRDFTRMLLEGLATIHGHGYVHCDLKPENILVYPSYVKRNGTWRHIFLRGDGNMITKAPPNDNKKEKVALELANCLKQRVVVVYLLKSCLTRSSRPSVL